MKLRNKILTVLLAVLMMFSVFTLNLSAENDETPETEENTETVNSNQEKDTSEEVSSSAFRSDDGDDLDVEVIYRMDGSIDHYEINSTDASEQTGIHVEVQKSRVKVTISRIGVSGTAKLYRLRPNEYFEGDLVTGLSKSVAAQGEFITSYELGKTAEITFNRYTSSAYDRLFSKFYLVSDDGEILAGPIYPTDIYSKNDYEPFANGTKKGVIVGSSADLARVQDLHAGNVVVNIDLASLIRTNEDRNGKPVDNSDGAIPFESNGETFYFSESEAKIIDSLVVPYSKAGINVEAVVIAWATVDLSRYPTALGYNTSNAYTMGYNTSTERGAEYWMAAMEFLAHRYSQSPDTGIINKFIIGNEIDYTYDWYRILPVYETDENGNYIYETSADANDVSKAGEQKRKFNRLDFELFMEEFARTFRMANLAVKKYNTGAKVMVSLTHNWAENCLNSYGMPNFGYYKQNPEGLKTEKRWNSYAPKDILDWLNAHEKVRGDFDWGIVTHPYPIGTSSSTPMDTDVNPVNKYAKPVTGDWRTTPWVTAANVEVYQLYLQQPENMYNGKVRDVSLSEASIINKSRENCANDEEYTKVKNQQAASIAMYYYRSASLDCVTDFDYFQPDDQPGTGYKWGLFEVDGTPKPSYEVYKYIDTDKSFVYSNRYLPYVSEKRTFDSWLDVMKAIPSDYNWDALWDEEVFKVRKIDDGDVEKTLTVNKTTFNSDEPILTTATGGIGDRVAIYKYNDDIGKADPIYYYYVVDGNIGTESGKEYNFLAYSRMNGSRKTDALLPPGNYVIALISGDTGEAVVKKTIRIASAYSLGGTTPALSTPKTTYQYGEAIIAAATGNANCWVGLYGKNDTPRVITSIYWYYNARPDEGIISGKPTILQTTTHNGNSSNPTNDVMPGEYRIYLFDGSGGDEYKIVTYVDITVEGSSNVDSLLALDYKLNDETDGFANGVVTVTKAKENVMANQAVLYWADENGKPLEGYTALAPIKLTGETTKFTMYTHTIIPEGAKKLIAYASNGNVLSENYVSVDLPEGCTYHLDEPETEFQIISDIHVIDPTDNIGEGGETEFSNQHFQQMLRDVSLNSPNSIGIFINGDIANAGASQEYRKVLDMFKDELKLNPNLPYLHISVGNHDWISFGNTYGNVDYFNPSITERILNCVKNNPNAQFRNFAFAFNPTLGKAPEHIYYDEVVGGYHFIYLGGEAPGLQAYLSQEQIQWFDQKMAECTAEDPEKPVFVMLHQSFYNTVAGSLPGENWDGVYDENSLKAVMEKYGQIILVNGHSHWELNSYSCMFPGDDQKPVAFNTAAVGYLWTGYNVITGEYLKGSHGYYVRVYDDKVVFMGRDFENNLWIPSALFVVQKNKIEAEQNEYYVTVDSESLVLDMTTADGPVTYRSMDPDIVTITDEGVVIAKKEGTAEIRITTYGTDTTVVDRRSFKIHVGSAAVTRVWGGNRAKTSVAAAEVLKKKMGVEKFNAIVVASGKEFPDALSGSYLAYKKEAPILLVRDTNAKDMELIANYVHENLAEKGIVYILGGDKAVSPEMEAKFDGLNVKRIKGNNRYETNIFILREAGIDETNDLLIATGKDFADSLSASATKQPILLVKDKLNDYQKAYIRNTAKNCNIVILGGPAAVSEDIENELKELSSNVTRIEGANRRQTTINIAKAYYPDAASAIFAYAKDFPDGLCAGVLGIYTDSPVILTEEGRTEAIRYAEEKGISIGYVMGGRGLLSDSLAKQLFRLQDYQEIAEEAYE